MSNNLRYKYAPLPEHEKDWRYRAKCLKEDPELFFPIGDISRGAGRAQAEMAKAVCKKCVVVDECLKEALKINAQGIWGGTTDDERDTIKRRKTRERRAAGEAIERS